MFTDAQLECISPYWEVGAYELCAYYLSSCEDYRAFDDWESHVKALGSYAKYAEANKQDLAIPHLDGSPSDIAHRICDFFKEQHDQLEPGYIAAKTQQALIAGRRAVDNHCRLSSDHEFSDGDIRLLQGKLNELRTLAINCESLSEEHRSRILRRIESLQLELHKHMSSLDSFWGLVGDAAIALGQAGRDAKPIVDRMREIMQIVWSCQARTAELPSNEPLRVLSYDGDNE